MIPRIVVSRLRHLGDVILTTPVLEALGEAYPEASIDYLTQEAFAPVLQRHPRVDRVLTLPAGAGIRDTFRTVRALRRPRVDWFFDLFAGPRSALLVLLCRPKHSVGTTRGLRSWVFTHRRADPGGSQVALHLDKLVPLLGATPERRPRIYVSDAERHTARARYGLDAGREEIFVHPGASWPSREWPLDRWPRLIKLLQEYRPGCRIHVVAPPGAEAIARGLASRCEGEVDALPAMGLRDLFSVLSWGCLYVGNDGGLLHAAVALGVPTVALIGGENDPPVWFPYEHLGPYRAVRRVSTHTATGPRGRDVGVPDADPAEVLQAARAVLPP